MTKYNDIIQVKQAAPVANFTISNFFPLVNEEITVVNISTDDDSFKWQLNNGLNIIENTVDDVVVFTALTPDDKSESITVVNTNETKTLTKHIYPLPIPDSAYYRFTIDKKVSRQDEMVTLTLINQYDFVGDHTLNIVVSNHETNAVVSSFIPTGTTHSFSLSTVGIYDIEIQANTNGTTVYNKQGMILTVTKKLALIENALVFNLKPTSEYSNGYASINGANYNGVIIAAGTTIIIERNETFPEDSIYRLRLDNLQGTAENPIIVTINSATPIDFGFESFWGIFIGGCKHLIIDGRGYQNIEYGINIHPSTDSGTMCVQGGGKSTNVEIHNIECHDASFAGIMFKTDPDVNDPTTWRPTVTNPNGFTCYDLIIHNNYFHYTGGEGNYLGYFNSGYLTRVDSQGITQTYRPHQLINTKVYRNKYFRCGWDSLQLNNAYDSEVAFNTITDSAWLGETNQNTGMSISLSGSIHDNIVNGSNGLAMQILPFGTVDIYNNLFYNLPNGVSSIMLLGGEATVPETLTYNPVTELYELYNSIPINIFNNNLIVNGNGFIVTAQNVIQYNGLSLKNNAIKYINNLFSGQAQTTLDIWTANASNNIKLDDVNQAQFKIGSISDGDFNYYPDSTLATGGLLIGNMYDIRGYKNWISNSKFIGAYASIIKLPLTILEALSINLNNGVAQTRTRIIPISYLAKGYPSDYMVSENSGFTGSVWTPITPEITFTLSESDGTKVVYFKLKNSSIESNVVSSTIYYSESLRYLISLNPSAVYNSPAPWNNFVGDPAPIGTKLTGLKDQYGDTSQLMLVVTSSFDGGATSASTEEIYPYLAKSVARNWIVRKTGSVNGVGTIVLSGCTINKVYSVSLYSNRLFLGGDNIYSVNGTEVVYNNSPSGINDICVFNNVVPIDGTITISVKPNSIFTHDGELGLLDIKEHNAVPVLDSILINNDDVDVFTNTVTVTVNQQVFPAEYMISESPTFADAVWKLYGSDSIPYTFNNNVIETKTIYVKLRNTSGESSTKSDSINYLGTRLNLSSISINYGAASTPIADVLVNVTYSGGVPTKYMISERSDFSGATWIMWGSSLISYILSSVGTKTIYLKISDDVYETSYVSDSINYFILSFNSLLLNNGSPSTQTSGITVNINYSGGTPTNYKLSETADLNSLPWLAWSGSTIPFILSDGYGLKTIYAEIKDQYTTSNTLNSSINYVSDVMVLLTSTINNGDLSAFSREVNVDITYDGTPNEYLISEDSNFVGATWNTFTGSTIPFTLTDEYGLKTVYIKTRTESLYESNVLTSTITYAQLKTIVSLAGATYVGSGYDTSFNDETINVIGYAKNEANTDFPIKDNSGAVVGSFVVKPSEFPAASGYTIQSMLSDGTRNPVISGNLGVYPDTFINKFYYTTSVNISGNRGLIRFKNIEEGEYTVRILESTSAAYSVNTKWGTNIKVNNSIVSSAAYPINNVSGFTTIKGVSVTADGFLDLYFFNTTSVFYLPGVNLIEFYKETIDHSTATYLIDLGSNLSGRNSPYPYNNFTVAGNAVVPQNSTITNLVSTDNRISSKALLITSDNFNVKDDAISTDSTYIGTAMRDSFGVLSPASGSMQLTGCNDAKTYTVKILQSKAVAGANVETTVNGVMKTQNTTGNITPLVWESVTSTGGVINISTLSVNATTFAQINVIELIEA